MVKTCTKCGDEKPLENFSFKNTKKGTRQPTCKECFKVILKQDYQVKKDQYISRSKSSGKRKLEYLEKIKSESPCKDCGNFHPHYVMEFDHLKDKVEAVSRMTHSSWKQLLTEIEKCDILCSNCHAVRTWKRRIKPS